MFQPFQFMMMTYRFRGIGNSLDDEALLFGLYGLWLVWRGKLPEFPMRLMDHSGVVHIQEDSGEIGMNAQMDVY